MTVSGALRCGYGSRVRDPLKLRLRASLRS